MSSHKQQWRRAHPDYAGELRQDIEADSATTMRRWSSRNRPPLWIRLKWRIQGRDPITGQRR